MSYPLFGVEGYVVVVFAYPSYGPQDGTGADQRYARLG